MYKRKYKYFQAQILFYSRCASVEQNLDSQIIALKAANCEIIRTEQKSGNNLAGRIEL